MKKAFSIRIIARIICCAVFLCIIPAAAAQNISSESIIDWTQKTFVSTVQLDMAAAGLTFPAGKNTALTSINTKLPMLLKDPLLALYVDSSMQLGDLVLNSTLPYDTITSIIGSSEKTPGIYSQSSLQLTLNHTLDLQNIGRLLIKHNKPYTPDIPVEQTASRPYTGIIIDARGTMPVQGEFVSAEVEPCFFPKIWDETMTLLYERNMMDPETARQNGIVAYDYTEDATRYRERIGIDPLWIKARKVYGINRTDPVISRTDALKILSVPENLELLRTGKVVILLDEDKLIHPAAAPQKDEAYYVVLREITRFLYENKVPDVVVNNSYTGTQISIQNLQFVADSSELLPAEKERLDSIADMLRDIADSNEFSITVEGHTASVGKPTGELNLSIERAQAIIQAMADRGVNTSEFTYKGFGGTVPLGDNATEEGRAQNRRVEILIIPKATYIQKDWGATGSMEQ